MMPPKKTKKKPKPRQKCKHCGEHHYPATDKETHRAQSVDRTYQNIMRFLEVARIGPDKAVPAMAMILINQYLTDRPSFEALLIAMRNDFERHTSDAG